MNAETIFDVCLAKYRACFEQVYVAGRLHALDASAFKEHRWKPSYRPRPEDYMADFWLAGHKVLEKKNMHSRLVLFDIHFCGTAPYERARRFLGLSEMGWVRWTEEIRKMVGQELERRGLYPPEKYFGW